MGTDMNLSEHDTNTLRNKASDHAKREFAEFALAGLRRPAYAAVFDKLPGCKLNSYGCNLLLDGYERNLTIRLKQQNATCTEGRTQAQYFATIQGLPMSVGQQPIALVQRHSSEKHAYLTGTLELGVAKLVITVLPHRNTSGIGMFLCILEVLRCKAK